MQIQPTKIIPPILFIGPLHTCKTCILQVELSSKFGYQSQDDMTLKLSSKRSLELSPKSLSEHKLSINNYFLWKTMESHSSINKQFVIS